MSGSQRIQVFPRGWMVEVRGDLRAPECRIKRDQETKWRKPTDQEREEINNHQIAEIYLRNEVKACQSSLVDDLLKSGEMEGFSCEDIEGVYADPSAWTLDQCHEYAQDNGIDHPSPNPWDDAEVIEWAKEDQADADAPAEVPDADADITKAIEVYRKQMIEDIDDEELDGLDDWREACREHSQDNPREAFEWWLVTDWLCSRLRDAGEIVIDNGYGSWWGRGCTGQAMIMDGTLQRIAAATEAAIAQAVGR